MKIWVIEPDPRCGMTVFRDYVNRLCRQTPLPLTEGSNRGIRAEKRLYPRIPCLLLVDYVAQGCAYRAFAKNISCDGAFVQSPRAVPTESEVVLVISILDETQTFKLAGSVVWAGQEGIGVKFDHLAGCEFSPPALTE